MLAKDERMKFETDRFKLGGIYCFLQYLHKLIILLKYSQYKI